MQPGGVPFVEGGVRAHLVVAGLDGVRGERGRIDLGPVDERGVALQDRWHPVLEGNATFVYRAEVDPATLTAGAVEPCDGEVRAYAALDEQNAARLREAGVTG